MRVFSAGGGLKREPDDELDTHRIKKNASNYCWILTLGSPRL